MTVLLAILAAILGAILYDYTRRLCALLRYFILNILNAHHRVFMRL